MRYQMFPLVLVLMGCVPPAAPDASGTLTMQFRGKSYTSQTDDACVGLCGARLGWHSEERGAYFMTFGDSLDGAFLTISVGWGGPYDRQAVPQASIISITQGDQKWSGARRLSGFSLTLGDPIAALADQSRNGSFFVEGRLEFAAELCDMVRNDMGAMAAVATECSPVTGTYSGPVEVAARNAATAGY